MLPTAKGGSALQCGGAVAELLHRFKYGIGVVVPLDRCVRPFERCVVGSTNGHVVPCDAASVPRGPFLWKTTVATATRDGGPVRPGNTATLVLL